MDDGLGCGRYASKVAAKVTLTRTATLALVDQAVASASNLLVVVVAARSMGVRDFGLFALALLLYSILVPAVQAVVGQELQLRTGTEDERLRASAAAVKASIALGAICGGLLLAGAVLAPSSGAPLVALAMCLPLLAAQEVIRGAAVVCGAVHVALISDGIWLALVVAATVVVELGLVDPTPTTAVLVWGLSGCAAAALVGRFFFQAGSESGRRYRRSSFVGYRFLIEFALMRATSQALILLLGVVAGVSALGAYRGATSLIGPLTVAVLSIANFGAPLAARVQRDRWSSLATGGAVLVFGCVLLYTVVLLLMPLTLGEALLGASWSGARTLLPPIALMTACTGVSAIFAALIRLLEPTRTLALRVVAAAIMPPLFVLGYRLGAVEGAAWGLAAATVAQMLMMAVQFRRLYGAARSSEVGSRQAIDVTDA